MLPITKHENVAEKVPEKEYGVTYVRVRVLATTDLGPANKAAKLVLRPHSLTHDSQKFSILAESLNDLVPDVFPRPPQILGIHEIRL